jgi:hypothetical protein
MANNSVWEPLLRLSIGPNKHPVLKRVSLKAQAIAELKITKLRLDKFDKSKSSASLGSGWNLTSDPITAARLATDEQLGSGEKWPMRRYLRRKRERVIRNEEAQSQVQETERIEVPNRDEVRMVMREIKRTESARKEKDKREAMSRNGRKAIYWGQEEVAGRAISLKKKRVVEVVAGHYLVLK